MMKITMYAVVAAALATAGPAVRAQMQTITAGCTTDATGGDGVRRACTTEMTRISAPDGHVFAERTLVGGKTSANGSEHDCRVGWDDFVEVIPGTKILQPRTITLQAHARSPRGHFSGRGWVACRYEVQMARYQP